MRTLTLKACAAALFLGACQTTDPPTPPRHEGEPSGEPIFLDVKTELRPSEATPLEPLQVIAGDVMAIRPLAREGCYEEAVLARREALQRLTHR